MVPSRFHARCCRVQTVWLKSQCSQPDIRACRQSARAAGRGMDWRIFKQGFHAVCGTPIAGWGTAQDPLPNGRRLQSLPRRVNETSRFTSINADAKPPSASCKKRRRSCPYPRSKLNETRHKESRYDVGRNNRASREFGSLMSGAMLRIILQKAHRCPKA